MLTRIAVLGRGFRAPFLLCLIAVVVQLSPAAVDLLEYDRALIAAGELWRIVTCQWTGQFAWSQTTEELKKEIDDLKRGQPQIQQQLKEIKQLLQNRNRPTRTAPAVAGKVFDLGSSKVKGNPDAFGSYVLSHHR